MNEFGENVFILDHPLITHKISILRDKTTGTNEFRQLVEEIADGFCGTVGSSHDQGSGGDSY